MGVIDVHTHAFPDKLAKRAVPMLAEEADWKPYLDGRVKSLIKSMDKADIDVSVVCSIATKPEQVEGILQWCLEIRCDRIEPFPSVHPDTPDVAGWMKRFAAEGLMGIKLHPMYQGFAADDERAMPIYRAAAEAGLIVEIHCGRDVAFPPEDDRAAPARIRRVLKAVPALRLIATHLGGWRMWDEVERELLGASCLMETSFTTFEMPAERVVRLVRAQGAERVLFGTDSPWADQSQELQRVRDLGLTEPELEKVLFSNAARLLRL